MGKRRLLHHDLLLLVFIRSGGWVGVGCFFLTWYGCFAWVFWHRSHLLFSPLFSCLTAPPSSLPTYYLLSPKRAPFHRGSYNFPLLAWGDILDDGTWHIASPHALFMFLVCTLWNLRYFFL